MNNVNGWIKEERERLAEEAARHRANRNAAEAMATGLFMAFMLGLGWLLVWGLDRWCK